MASHSKLTDELQARLIEAIESGNFRVVAAEYCGISKRTFQNWMRRGLLEVGGVFEKFRLAILEAERRAEMRMVRLVMLAAEGDAKHAEWWLERKCHERWGKREAKQAEVTNKDKAAKIDLTSLTDEQLDILRRALHPGDTRQAQH